MGEGGDRHIIVDIDRQRLGVALGGVGLAVDSESLRHLAEVRVEDGLVALAPGGGYLFVGVGLDSVEICFQHCVKLAMDMLLFAIVETGVNIFGHCAVAFPDVGHVEGRASGGEMGLAVHAYVAVGLLEVALADGEHRAQVERVAPLA